MFKIKIAGLVIGIEHKYDYVRDFCDNYLVETDREDFRVSVTEEEVLEEQRDSEMRFPIPLCECVCLYRAICLRLFAYDAFLMHSAVVEVDGKAYAFAAESGVGKSTHMKLWLDTFGDRARVVNGDKPVYRFLEGKLYACGTPWCGKEGLENNIMSPVKAICFLERSPENRIRRLSTSEVIGRIFHQLLIPREEEDMNRFMDMIDRMITTIDCYLLQCNMDPEAALVAYQAMGENK